VPLLVILSGLESQLQAMIKPPLKSPPICRLKVIFIHFDEGLNELPTDFKIEKENTLIIYTPAIPKNHEGLNVLIQNGFKLYKRAEILGLITNNHKTIAVAGTHGKHLFRPRYPGYLTILEAIVWLFWVGYQKTINPTLFCRNKLIKKQLRWLKQMNLIVHFFN
jgi:hypothetical protein